VHSGGATRFTGARRPPSLRPEPSESEAFPKRMIKFINWLLTWWNGSTIGTTIYTWRNGQFVGEDIFGNRYYRDKTGRRRWVIYKTIAEPSQVPAEWHGWLHHTYAEPPTVDPPKVQPWETEHVPNLTGTPYAYRPAGSLLSSGQRPAATGDYEAWRPD
jgi:NADH:ubiquinone oxidoreductase subunit